MTIAVDTREKARAITKILAEFDERGVPYVSTKLYCGDYQDIANGLNVVDRKQNLLELAGNLGKDWPRFKRELQRAQEAGIHITVLCEHGRGVSCLDDVAKWVNPRLKESPLCLSGEALYRKMTAISRGYGVAWEFCDKKDTGRRILEILGAMT